MRLINDRAVKLLFGIKRAQINSFMMRNISVEVLEIFLDIPEICILISLYDKVMFERQQLHFIFWIIVILEIVCKNVEAIYGGDFVRGPEENPFMVHIEYKRKYICGGGIVDKIHVITSGQCVFDNTHMNDYAVISGDTVSTHEFNRVDRVSGVYAGLYPIKHIWRSKQYRKVGSLVYNDIAVFTVNKNFDARLKPLLLPPFGLLPKLGSLVKLTGWGICRPGSTTCSRILKQLYLPITNQAICIAKARMWWDLGNEHLCLQHGPPDFTSGATDGDFGSILSFKNHMVGFVTLPTADIHPERYDIYIKVGHYHAFFDEVKRRESELDSRPQPEHPVCQPSTSQTEESRMRSIQCDNYKDYICLKLQTEWELFQRRGRSDQIVPSQGTSDQETGIKRPNTSQNRAISPKRLCVASENVHADSERYYRVNPESYASVAQDNNVQPGDVAEFRCRNKFDNEDEFIEYILFGTPRTSSTEPQEDSGGGYFGTVEHPEHHDTLSTEQSLPSHQYEEGVSSSDRNVIPGFAGTLQNPEAGSSRPARPASSDGSLDVQWNHSSEDESDLLNYNPRPLPHGPDFTPPSFETHEHSEHHGTSRTEQSLPSHYQQTELRPINEEEVSSSDRNIIPGYAGTLQNPEAGPSRPSRPASSDGSLDMQWNLSPENESDLLNFNPRPLPPGPEFTPPNSN